MNVWFLLLFLEKEKEFRKRSVLTKFPRISILIPAHNEEKIISKTINSLLNIDYPKNKLEINVIDDGSSDRTYEIAKSFRSKKIKVYRKENGGKASALNYGLSKVRTNLMLVIDADCFLARDALKKMVAEIQDENTMAVIPYIDVYNPQRFLEKIQAVEYSFMNFFRKLTASIYAVFMAPAAVLYKTDFFRKYGKFDEKTITEDSEMGLRITSHHFNIANVFDAKVFTVVPNTLSKLMRQRVRWAYGIHSDLNKYKKLLSFKYGDLGTFALPQIPLRSGILIIILLLLFTSTLQDFVQRFRLLQLVGYDITTFLQLNFFYLLDIRMFIFLFILFLSLLNYLLVRRVNRGKVSFFYFLAYIFLYAWLLNFFELVAIFYFLLGKKPRW
jgi:cellulose synthase/poly-beta-1,6-N-acetylglucosamine synthase-like glycosyltransferase